MPDKRKSRPKAVNLKHSIGNPTLLAHTGFSTSMPAGSVISFSSETGSASSGTDTSKAPPRPPRSDDRLTILREPMSPTPADDRTSFASGLSFYMEPPRQNAAVSPTASTDSDEYHEARFEALSPTMEEAEITFRQPFQQAKKMATPARTLYSPTSGRPSPSISAASTPALSTSPAPAYEHSTTPQISSIPPPTRTTTIPNQIGSLGRRASLVNPDDYLPGIPAPIYSGKAMTAGFEPAKPPRARLSSYTPPPVGRRRSSLRNPIIVAGSAANGTQAIEEGLDLSEPMPEVYNPYDEQKIFSVGPQITRQDSDDQSDIAVVPTLYNNNYVKNDAVAVTLSDSKDSGYTKFPESIPRDPVTGKIDWRARLGGKSPASLESQESPVKEYFSPSFSPYNGNEKLAPVTDAKSVKSYFSSAASITSKRGEHPASVVALRVAKYSSLGKIMLRASPFTFLLSSAATAFYLYLRSTNILKAQTATGDKFHAAWIFFMSEFLFSVWIFWRSIKQLLSMRLTAATRYTLKGDVGLPTVDILVICSGQDASMIMDSTVAAARLDWPVDKLRILVIDETGSEIIKRSVEYYANNRALHVTYHRRNKNAIAPRNGWTKSSSINFGLAETRADGRISGEYVLVLDAESIPEPNILRTMLPHLIQNPILALVQTRQGFYNMPKSLGISFSTFIRAVEPSSDARSGFAVRRSAVDDIGGFPTRSTIGDNRLKSVLRGKGYKTMWIDDVVQYSLLPESFSTHLNQRIKRKLAHIGTGFRLGFFLFSTRTRYMPFSKRMAGLERMISPWFSLVLFFNMMAFPAALFCGGFLVPALSINDLNFMLWSALAAMLAERTHDIFFSMPTGEASARRFIQAEVFMAPYTMLGMLKSLVPLFMRRADPLYWTAVPAGEPTERDPKGRNHFGSRLGSVLFKSHGWTHAFVLSSILASVGYSLWASLMPLVNHERNINQTALLVLMTVAWPTLPWVHVFLGSFVPFSYAILPPSVPQREQLLHREPISAVARPLPETKSSRPFKQGFLGQAILSTFLIGYAVTVFVFTFIDLHLR